MPKDNEKEFHNFIAETSARVNQLPEEERIFVGEPWPESERDLPAELLRELKRSDHDEE